MGKDEKRESLQASSEYLGLKEFFSIIAKTAGVLAGFATLFLLFGYSISLSFVSKMQLYGLLSFPSEFYKDATLRFVGDMFQTYGRHPVGSAFMGAAIVAITLIALKYNRNILNALRSGIADFIAWLGVLTVTMLTLRLENMPDMIFGIAESRKIFLFMIAVPVLVGIFVYLAARFGLFVKNTYKNYYVMVFLFLALFISIPVGYGDTLFDVDLYPIAGFDYADGTKIESLNGLRKDIQAQEGGTLFFLMGHSTDKVIIFDNQLLSPPAKLIIVERDLIKYLRVSRRNLNTLRNIMGKQQGGRPLEIFSKSISVESLPAELWRLLR